LKKKLLYKDNNTIHGIYYCTTSMVVGLVKGQLTVAILKERLGLPPKRKACLKELLIDACKKNLLTAKEFELTVPKKESVVKCYLYSVITKPEYRSKIEDYVLAASQLFTRGSYIANLMALKRFGPVQRNEVFPRFSNNLANTKPLFDLMEEENSLLKQIFCPERWPLAPVMLKSKIKNADGSNKFKNSALLLTEIKDILDENRVTMDNLRPDWEAVMSASGWDNSINRMYSKYRANIQVSLMNPIPALLKKYFHKVQMADDSFRPLLQGLIQRPLRPMECHNDDFEHIVYLRQYLGYGKNQYMPRDFDYTDRIFDFVIGLKKLGVGGGTYLPVSDLGRKYSYIDMKITQGLFGTTAVNDKTFAEIYDLTKAAMKARRKKLRKELRQRYKNDKKKMKKRWGSVGIGSIPKGTSISSFETDGVGMSIVIKKPINIFQPDPPPPTTERLMMNDPVFIGVDDGRAKAFTAAISTKGYKKPAIQMLTRKKYYFEMKHNIRMKWERARAAATTVNQLLSLHPKSTDFLGYMECANANLQTIKTEYLIDKGRALWRMRLYRLKTRSLDKAVQKLFDAAKGRPIVFGIGNAKFAPGGRGELSMPTTMLTKFFKKGMNRYIKKNNVVLENHVRFVSIDEYKTTQCCSRSGEQTTAPMTNSGRRSRRLRFSSFCQEQNGRGLRDRDIQAAENMLWCTQAVYYGYERPSYLTRP